MFKNSFIVMYLVAVLNETVGILYGEGVVQQVCFYAGFIILIVFGYLLGMKGAKVSSVVAMSMPFVLLWYAAGMLNIFIASMQVSESYANALIGNTVVILLLAPVAVLSSVAGFLLSGLFSSSAREGRGDS